MGRTSFPTPTVSICSANNLAGSSAEVHRLLSGQIHSSTSCNTYTLWELDIWAALNSQHIGNAGFVTTSVLAGCNNSVILTACNAGLVHGSEGRYCQAKRVHLDGGPVNLGLVSDSNSEDSGSIRLLEHPLVPVSKNLY